ncbi:MAG: hypothetical protein AAF160_20715 [Pseudomonadota bacterium]
MKRSDSDRIKRCYSKVLLKAGFEKVPRTPFFVRFKGDDWIEHVNIQLRSDEDDQDLLVLVTILSEKVQEVLRRSVFFREEIEGIMARPEVEVALPRVAPSILEFSDGDMYRFQNTEQIIQHCVDAQAMLIDSIEEFYRIAENFATLAAWIESRDIRRPRSTAAQLKVALGCFLDGQYDIAAKLLSENSKLGALPPQKKLAEFLNGQLNSISRG